MRRLLSLDYVIEHTDLPWLPTKHEKVGAFEALDISRFLLAVRGYRGAAGGTQRHFPLGLPVALDSRRALFVYADPGYDIATALGTWRDRCRRLWEAVRERGGSVEAVGVVRARGQLKRARTILGNWASGATASGPSLRPVTVTSVRREIARIKQATLGMDDGAVAKMGGFQACRHRIVELKDLLPPEPAGPAIDGYSVWRASRYGGAGFDRR